MSSSFPKLASPVVLSPMAGVTDVAFRTLAKRYGAALTYTEFVSSAAIVRNNTQTLRMIETDPSEKPVAVQLFGSSIDEVVAAAQQIEHRFDIIDVNCGCPVWKVIRTGAGSALLKEPENIAKFVNRLASAVNKPVTVKIRAGINENSINAVPVARLVEDAGAAAIAIHGRTQQQGYSGTADWGIIKKVKEAVNIPVIGNGDVFTPIECKSRLEETGVDAIMIARGAIGNPFIFRQMIQYLNSGSYDEGNRIDDFFQYCTLAEKYAIEFNSIKGHALGFTKGMHDGSFVRDALSKATSIEQLKNILSAYASPG